MISAEAFCAQLDRAGVGLVTGVPCSFFGGPLRLLHRQPGRYLPAANEGAALAVAAGAELAGRRSAVLIQNSGFGNLVNPLTSLVLTFDIPALVFMSLRGWPDPDRDEPQHAVMGRHTHGLLDTLGVRYWVLEPEEQHLAAVLDATEAPRRAGRPAFVLVPKGTIAPAEPLPGAPAPAPAPFARRDALAALVPFLDDTLVFTTTGFISRELYGLADRPATFYMQGSMGHALALGLGAAQAQPGRRVVVVDGDGAVQMHMGTCLTVGAAAPDLLHVVLDNGAYESTGGQSTVSGTLDWPAFGAAAGYRSAALCADAAGLTEALSRAAGTPGPHLVVARIATAPAVTPPRVTSGLAPAELRRRFQSAATR
jgi:phosphonopyruvate decarboxylase